MQYSFITSITILASLMAPAFAAGPPKGCKQTATGKVGFCICSTASVVPSTTTVLEVQTITTTVPVEKVTDVTTYITDPTYLRGPSCFPPSPSS